MRKRGFTLAELLINAGLVALLATVVLTILVRGLRLGMSTYKHLEVTQRVELAARQWAQDVANCGPSGVTLAPRGMIAQSLNWVSDEAAPLWTAGWTVYRQDPQHRLLRSTWKTVTGVTWEPLRASVPTAPQQALVWDHPGPQERVLLTSLSRFVVRWEEGSRVLTLELGVTDGEESWQLNRSVRLRNEG